MQQSLSILAGLMGLVAYIPYAIDILKGRARPARSARIMLLLLLALTLVQQNAVHSGWLMAVTIGELIGSAGILALAVRRGEGGLSRLDRVCYLLITADVALWLSTGSALLALHLSIVADTIAFMPTLVKTWRRPHTETPTFFAIGAAAPLLNVLAAGRFSYAVVVFPVYLALANAVEIGLILGRGRVVRRGRPQSVEPVI